jgi:prepilin peptidase CpaA
MGFSLLLDDAPLLALLTLAAVIDLRRRRIPNWLTFGLIASGLARAWLVAGVAGAAGLIHATAGLFAAASIPFFLFALGALGGGDVKLLAGVGAWLGAEAGLAVFAVQSVIGLALVLVTAVSQGRTLLLFRNSAVLACDMAQHGVAAGSPRNNPGFVTSIDRPLPYAVPVLAATVVVILAGHWLAFAA